MTIATRNLWLILLRNTLEQMRQYCKCVLAVLDNDYPGNWKAHFLYAYYHLLQDPCHSLPRELSYFSPYSLPNSDDCPECTFGRALWHIMHFNSLGCRNSHDIIRISYDLTEGSKQASIFAMSASYCLASLCDEQSAGQDWDLMSETSLFETGTVKSIPMDRIHNPKPRTIISVPFHIHMEIRQSLFLMDFLPHILPLAGRYEPLVDMCRNKSFSPHSQLWPKKSGHAREAIDSYLRRMDSQEGMEM
ncbi:hypothetical protein CPC08DRAFT_246386 [Agrocybe pediades]|nr:hypothetical protein CPC08DRAFT_246386 [Agrocybe pediades]